MNECMYHGLLGVAKSNNWHMVPVLAEPSDTDLDPEIFFGSGPDPPDPCLLRPV